GVLAGLLPAMRMAKGNVNETLKQGLGTTDTDAGSERTRSALVVFEVALTLMLLIGAGLMIRSLWILRRVDAGFNAQNVLTMQVSIAKTKFAYPTEEVNFFNRVLERVRGLPGIQAVGIVDDLPLMGGSHQPFSIQGRPVLPMAEQPEVDVRVISPGYLRAIGIPVIRGRDISEGDIAGRPGVALISESMAKHFWPNEDPIGKHLTLTFTPDVVREVIGVVRDVKQDGLDQQRAPDSLYDAFAQVTPETTGGWRSIPMMLAVRTSSDPAIATSAIVEAIHGIDREVPLLKIATMESVVSDSLTPQRLNMQLLATFAGLALLLAAVGTYSVLSYNVRRRVREIGIRMALGAQVRDVLRLILMQGMRPTLAGVVIGLAGALALNRVLANLVFGVKPADPLTFLCVPALLASVGLFASVIPAYRATRIEPMKTLRDE